MSREDGGVLKGEFERFGTNGCTLNYRVGGASGDEKTRPESAKCVSDAIAKVPDLLGEFGYTEIDAHKNTHPLAARQIKLD